MVCPENESRCEVSVDRRDILLKCTGYGTLAQLPSACTDTRIIAILIIGQGTTVSRLQHRILEGLQMRKLQLAGLGIVSVSVSAFEAISSQLEFLHLQDNHIESLPLGVFRTLFNLRELELHNNRLTQLTDGMFTGLTNLHYLTLNKNRISAVDSNTWRALPSLVTLVLDDNLLSEGGLVFPNGTLNDLQELRVERNRLGAITDDIISGLPSLRRLYFRSNGVESLPGNVFLNSSVGVLELIDLSANNITQLNLASFNGKCTIQIHSSALIDRKTN